MSTKGNMGKKYTIATKQYARKLFLGFVLLISFGLVYSDSIPAEPQRFTIAPQKNLYDVVSFFPFHFPMEVTFAPGYKPVVPSLGTELLFAHPGAKILASSYDSPLQMFYDPSPSTLVDPILRDRTGASYLGLSAYRSPGVVFLVSRNQFSFHLDLNLRMTLDLSGQATTNLLRTGFGVSYNIPSAYLASRQYSAKVDLSVQAIEFQPWEERRKDKTSNPNRQFYLSPGITIGSQRGWMVEGLIRMPLPNTVQELTDTTYKPEVQGRLGLKWYLPESIEK